MKQSCRECGFPFEPGIHDCCPKCQHSGAVAGFRAVLEIDVAHSGESWAQAKEMIIGGLDRAIAYHHKALRVIHGYGSSSGMAVIAPQAIALMRHLAEQHEGRFAKDHRNPGVSLIWLNKPRRNPSSQAADAGAHLSDLNRPPLQGNWFDEAMRQADKRSRDCD